MSAPLSLTVAGAPRLSRALDACRRELSPWRPYLLLVAVFVGGSQVVGPLVGWWGTASLLTSSALLVAVVLPLLGVCSLLAVWRAIRATDRAAGGALPLVPLVRHAAAPALRALVRLWARTATIVLTATASFATGTAWRLSIPAVHPYAWDRELDAADRWLHGGMAPWQLAHMLAGNATAYAVLDFLYSRLWLLASIGLIASLILAPAGRKTQRILVSFVLTHAVLASGLAMLGSSVGPIYAARASGLAEGADPYAGLHAALATFGDPTVPFSALWYQDYLWRIYLSGNLELTAGITAFPSMHVGFAMLLMLAAWSWRPWAGAIAAALGCCTLFGSVYFGWHYALDGYASILVVGALWWIAGRIVRAGPPHAPTMDAGA